MEQCSKRRQYIPETLMNAVQELDAAYEHYKHDPGFQAELTALLNDYAGRPSRLYYAGKVTADLGGAKVYLKREDLNHTGAHKINNVLGQALLAKRMGKTRLIAETGAGQHGVATATAAALMGMECVVFMGGGGYQAAGIERLSDAAAGRGGSAGHQRHRYAEGRLLRRLPGMDQPYFRYPLLHRFRNGAASLPYHGQGSDHRCQHFRPGRQGLCGHRPLAQNQWYYVNTSFMSCEFLLFSLQSTHLCNMKQNGYQNAAFECFALMPFYAPFLLPRQQRLPVSGIPVSLSVTLPPFDWRVFLRTSCETERSTV